MTNEENNSRDADEVVDLLKEFYQPDEQLQEFEEFYQAIEDKLEAANPLNKIQNANNQMQDSYLRREQRLEEFITQLEQTQIIKKQNYQRAKYSKQILVVAVIILLIGLTSIARLQNANKYNYVSVDSDVVDWNILGLTDLQKDELNKLDKAWHAVESKEQMLIATKKNLLAEEMQAEHPDLSLIDKYQRDILDHEANLKRERLNSFLEKRFILNEEQSLKLIHEIGKKSIN